MTQHWDAEVDLLSIGSGCGGLSAAITAHDEGLEAMVLEKTDKVGGVTAYSFGQVWCGANHLAAAAGIADSLDATREYFDFMAVDGADEDNLDSLIRHAPGVIEYLAQRAGVRFTLIPQFADYYFPHAPGSLGEGRFLEVEPIPGALLGEWQEKTRTSPHAPRGITQSEMIAWGGPSSPETWDAAVISERLATDTRTLGPGLAAYLVKAALVDRNIRCLTGTAAKELIAHDGAVVGVRAEHDGADYFIRARRGVVVATSGYDGNPGLAQTYERVPEWNTVTFPGLTGDGLVMGAEVGALVANVPVDMTLPGFHVPGESNDGAPMYRFANAEIGLYGIVVNRRGARFADESFYRAFLTGLQQFDAFNQEFTNFPAYFVFDARDRGRYALGSISPGQDLPDGMAVCADTLRDLAVGLGVDADGLEDTVARFNEFARDGKDPDFGRGELPWARQMWGDLAEKQHSNIGPVEEPPFYGVRLTYVGVGQNNAGLSTDPCGRVRHVRGHTIPGLYAVGNAAAYLELRRGYQSGLANARGMVFGHLAALDAARQPTRDA